MTNAKTNAKTATDESATEEESATPTALAYPTSQLSPFPCVGCGATTVEVPHLFCTRDCYLRSWGYADTAATYIASLSQPDDAGAMRDTIARIRWALDMVARRNEDY